MEVKQINQLMLAMRRTGIKKLVLKKEGVELELESEEAAPLRPFDGEIAGIEENPMHSEIERHRQTHTVASQPNEKMVVAKSLDQEKEDALSVYVTSPMVGTVYYSPSPNDPPFVKAGDRVEKNTVVCIIEAMKVMNEVKAGVAGLISAPLIENGHPVEFGSKLFRMT